MAKPGTPEMKTFLSMQTTIKGHITNSLDGLCMEAIARGWMTYDEKADIQEGAAHRQCTRFLEYFGRKINTTPAVFYDFRVLLGTLRTCDGVVKELGRWLKHFVHVW